jgi:transposase
MLIKIYTWTAKTRTIRSLQRTQINLFPVSLDQTISPENEVRINRPVFRYLSLKNYGFRMDYIENCHPAYYPSDLLELFIYGYLNKVRSSRDLEKECMRNIEPVC